MDQQLTAREDDPRLRIQLLGGFAVWLAGERIADDAWRSRRARSLVKLLALASGQRIQRDQILDVIWPDSTPETAANNLHQTLYATRHMVAPDCLRLEDGVLRLCGPAGEAAWVDADQFAAAASAAKDSHDPAVLQAALALYSGELLPEDRYEEWTQRPRQALRETWLKLLLDLASLYEQRQAYTEGIDVLRQLLAEDPSHEEAHTRLIRLYALSGQRQAALRQYQALAQALHEELETEPGETAARLFAEIQAGTFPPARTAVETIGPAPELETIPHHNLPAQLTSFIGREDQITELIDLVKAERLVTITGAGGTGKTRLSLRAAEELLAHFPDGVWLVELAPLSDPDLVVREAASALSVRQQSGQELVQTLVGALRTRRMLLVLDNCEHVLEAAADLAGHLLSGCPQLRILATSREVLSVAGEAAYYCPSLSLPEGQNLEHLGASEAACLFVERARAVLSSFQLSENNARAVGQVCRRLDGIPLAIELAAARMRMLTIEQIAARLEDVFGLLTGGSRSALPRHRTLRACIDWSYHLLSPHEQVLLSRLSVFAGGWTLGAAEEVCSNVSIPGTDKERQVWKPDLQKKEGGTSGGSGNGNVDRVSIPGSSQHTMEGEPDHWVADIDAKELQVWKLQKKDVLDLLGGLVDKSLVQFEPSADGEARYRMLETVRQYARERLVESGHETELRERHLDYFQALALQAEPHLRAHGAKDWLDRLEHEIDNIRLALDWSQVGSIQKGLRLAAALWTLWLTRGLYFEGAGWLERLLQVQEDRPAGQALDLEGKVARGRALNVLSNLITGSRYETFLLRPDPSTEAEDRESQAIFEELGEAYRLDLAIARYNEASSAIDLQALLACRDQFLALEHPFWTAECDLKIMGLLSPEDERVFFYGEESLALYRQVGDRYDEGRILKRLANSYLVQGNHDRSSALANQSLICLQSVGDMIYAETARGILVTTARLKGDSYTAYEHTLKIRDVARKMNSRELYGLSLYLEADIAQSSGEYERAIRCCEEGLELGRDLRDEVQIFAFNSLALVALFQGNVERARMFVKKVIEIWISLKYYRYFFYNAIQILGMTAVIENNLRLAIILFGAQEAQAGFIKNVHTPRHRAEVAQAIAAARSGLVEEGFIEAWEAGQAMSEEQLVQLALENLP